MKHLLVILLFLAACSTVKDSGIIPYDPPGATTETKEIHPQKRRVIMAGSPGVFINNRHPSARVSDFWQEDSVFVALIQPEFHPINNSAWYAFQLMAAQDTTITLELRYEHGLHRYRPHLLPFHGIWETISDSNYRVDTAKNAAFLRLELTTAPLIVAAQPIVDTGSLVGSIAGFQIAHPDVHVVRIGSSHKGRDLIAVEVIPEHPKWMLPIIARQHPPEVTGFWAMEGFVKRLLQEDSLATAFREKVALMIVPMANPDGVDLGHWRLNAGGADLNRDWKTFNQPETKAISAYILEQKEALNVPVLYGFDFHSTSTSVMYTILPEFPTYPPGIEQAWLQQLRLRFPDLLFSEEAFGIEAPIFKNWIYTTFGAGAITFEVADTLTEEQAMHYGRAAAEAFMRIVP